MKNKSKTTSKRTQKTKPVSPTAEVTTATLPNQLEVRDGVLLCKGTGLPPVFHGFPENPIDVNLVNRNGYLQLLAKSEAFDKMMEAVSLLCDAGCKFENILLDYHLFCAKNFPVTEKK